MTCGRMGSGLVPELWCNLCGTRSGLFWTRETVCVYAQIPRIPGKYGPHGELLFFLIQKEPSFVPDSEAFNSFIGDGFRVPELKGRK